MTIGEAIPQADVPWVLGILLAAFLAAIGFLLRTGVQRELARVDAKASAEKVQALEKQLLTLERELQAQRKRLDAHGEVLAQHGEQVAILLDMTGPRQ